jgi:hypothetical protein
MDMSNFWDDRYRDGKYIYGTNPNAFFKEYIIKHPIGTILLPAEGEGRNAVYAAQCGWKVEAFDLSKEGWNKAIKLANQQNVNINYQIASFDSVEYRPSQFDVIALIYAHIPKENKTEFFRRLLPFLKTGGYVLFEGFSKEQREYQKQNESAGGPKDIDMLFSEDELSSIFHDLEIIKLEKCITTLSEGIGHSGESAIIRMIARKSNVK